ncbi:FKBP-type peptidyl-prolyl cis-trans isomerase [Flavitalea sp.]|nr:FKBP-type peptidyl-prolyl cis-trans isomerase [Flavitalea sp.]
MRKLVAGLALILLMSTGCNKKSECPENNDVAPAVEEQMVKDYLTANGITATKYKSNMYYQILTPGTGAFPNQCSTVEVGYNLKLTNGNTIPQSPGNQVFNLQGLIPAWIQGIPLVQEGGSIRLFAPPSLAYGSQPQRDANGNITIPGNSVLIFDINVVDIK